MGWRWLGAVAGCVCVGVLGGGMLSASAQAGVYHVYSCHTPWGDVAPTDGWAGTTNGPDAYALDDCYGRTTYALTVALDGAIAHAANQSNAIWGFTAAPGLRIAAATLYRHEGVPGGVGANSSYVTFLAAPNLAYDAADVFDNCQANSGCAARGTNNGGFDPSNAEVVPKQYLAGATHLYMEAYCGGTDGAQCPAAAGYAAEADLYEADLTLADDAAPQAFNPGGTLLAAGPRTGPGDITFMATDQGSGVYSGSLEIDGKTVATKVVNDNGGACQTVGQATDGVRDFRVQTPCRTSTSVDLPLDTSTLADGQHALAVTVDDAAGNVTSVWKGTITTSNAPQGGAPQITGVLAQGQRLTANPGSWSPEATFYSYQWLRCPSGPASCQAIPGAVGQVYVPAAADDYQSLAVDVTANNAAGKTTARAPVVGPVADLSGATSGGQVQALSGGLTGAPGKGGASGVAGGVGVAGGGSVAGARHTPNGTGACSPARLTATFGRGGAARVAVGGSATLRGQLDCAGHPIGGASLGVSIASDGSGSVPSAVTTAADGSFSLGLGAGPSRTVTVSYRAFADDAQPAATAVARLAVTPAISLTIAPARVRNGQTISYRGRVSGGFIPAAGLPLDVEYRDGSRWRIFDTTRARAPDGRYVYRYTFKRTTVAIVYSFRVVIPVGGVAGYPYAPAASRARSVRVNP